MVRNLGAFGAWIHPQYSDRDRVAFAVELEELGYRTVWFGVGADQVGDMVFYEHLLEVTKSIVISPAIVNVWRDPAEQVARAYHRITAQYGDRFVLGMGLSHPETLRDYRNPYEKLVDYLDRLDEGNVPQQSRILGALGPKMLSLAGTRAAGAHPYLVPQSYTQLARSVLGVGSLLAPEHKVVLEHDPVAARSIGRPVVHPYLRLSNYTNNLLRHGYTEQDLADGGSDRLIDDLVLHGDSDIITHGLRSLLEAGADHVGIQILPRLGESPMAGYRTLARELL
jgi:probable F420-dependent oxidoreductase